jgi:methyl-accepting chemotaxis protein
MRLTIGKRISFGYGLAVVLFLIIGFTSYRATNQLVDASEWREHSYQVISGLESLKASMIDAETGERGYLLTGDEGHLEPYRSALARVEQQQSNIRTLTADNPRQQVRVERLARLIASRLAFLSDVIQVRRDKGFEPARLLVAQGTDKRLMDDVRQAIEEMEAEEESLLASRSRDALEATSVAYNAIFGGGGIAVVIAMLSGFLVTRSITGPLAVVVDGTERVGSGSLGHRIKLGGDDELVDLSRAFNGMVQRRQESEAQIAAQSAERANLLGAVRETVQKLAAASQELVAGAAQQASGMQEQSAAVSETVTVVDEVAHTSAQAAERAKVVAASARHSEEIGRSGRKAVEEVIAIMATAKGQTDNVAEKITSLAEQTQTIGEIVSLITDIADQTNLLALNAAIEASRAGEQGRGFSVVASEVKALAEESKRATQRVRQILGTIQTMANTAVLSTEEGTRGMAAATKATVSAGEAIQALGAVIAEVADASAQIAASAGQQATGLTQIHQAMRDISQVSTQNLLATQQAQRAATDLTELGSKLQSLMST